MALKDSTDRAAVAASVPKIILVIVALFGVGLALGWPQRGTQAIVGGLAIAEAGPSNSASLATAPALWTVLPFVAILGAIAVLPMISATQHWWDSNLSKLMVVAGLGLLTLAYYALLHQGPVMGRWPAHHLVDSAGAVGAPAVIRAILENAILQEYVPFIVLLFSLYTICGGIRIEGDLRADPITNAAFLAVGAVLANLIGTTGAAMLLIRPLLETNQERRHVAHTVVMFIFIVCNCGGQLLPLGPPLFLGYLEGVPFFWTLALWPAWAAIVGSLLVIYVLLDHFVFYHRETIADIERDIERTTRLKFSGWQINAPLLLGIVLAVALLDPSKAFPGTSWHPWLYLREVVELGLVALSLHWGSQQVRDQNQFNFGAILEVAVLFIGIFICMQPALDILSVYGNQLGINTPARFFWASGSLSSVLDNAPTYLVFFTAAQSMHATEGVKLVAGVDPTILAAISLGSVCMGAMTYIGNGPNFMVKSIAERSGVRMPSFFGYMAYSFAILLPVFAIAVWQFLM
jgi:Na+/H+ antiporter NhaD/arsenite permease-like protein